MSGTTEATRPVGIDADALHRKYLEERDRRVRPDGVKQYIAIDPGSRYMHDPYVEPGFTRDPIERDVGFLIVGGGFAGLMTAARLHDQGVEDMLIVERGGDFGGTWYWNRYPGAACDVEAYIYMPLLEEIGYIPTQKDVGAPEI